MFLMHITVAAVGRGGHVLPATRVCSGVLFPLEAQHILPNVCLILKCTQAWGAFVLLSAVPAVYRKSVQHNSNFFLLVFESKLVYEIKLNP